jgi:hypothetical protein
MAELKSAKNAGSVDEFIASIEDETKRTDSQALIALMQNVTGTPPTMYGSAIVGFGNRRVRYANGKEIDWLAIGFAPRKANLSLYIPGGREAIEPLLERLGKHKSDGGCLYIKRLSDVDQTVLREIVETAVADLKP